MGGSFLVRAVGFFNDAYDLFVINIVNLILEQQYGNDYGKFMKSAVSTGVFVGSVAGQLVFGYYADRLGRKKIMIYTAALLIFGGILCTASYGGSALGTLWMLVFSRAILGFGIGGEYPLSCTSTAEGTTAKNRGKAVSTTFSMQGVGQLAAAIIGNLLVQALANSQTGDYDKTNLEIIWRLLFGIGTVPAILILYPRIKAEESHHFQRVADPNDSKADELDPKLQYSSENRNLHFRFILKHYGWRLFGTSMSWFLFDVVFYAQSIFSSTIIKSLGNDPSLQEVSLMLCLIAFAALPGYFVAIATIDKIGRKNMQIQGFVAMTILFAVIGLCWDEINESMVNFMIAYAFLFFFFNFGPNTTTFIIPVESFPTSLRATCHGISAAMGKLGAVAGTSMFEPMEHAIGIKNLFIVCAAISLICIPVTYFFIQDRSGELEMLDIELERFLEQEDESTQSRLSVCYRESLDIAHNVVDLEGKITPRAAPYKRIEC